MPHHRLSVKFSKAFAVNLQYVRIAVAAKVFNHWNSLYMHVNLSLYYLSRWRTKNISGRDIHVFHDLFTGKSQFAFFERQKNITEG